jgi:AraC-like DNA-binding protein
MPVADPIDLVVGSRLEERRPAMPLAALVSIAYVKLAARDEPYSDLTIPNGCVELRCTVGATPMIFGPQTGPLSKSILPGATEIGLRFRAGAAASVIGVPASELRDQTVSFADLFGRGASADLSEQIAESASPADALRHLQGIVEKRLADGAGPDPLIREVVRRLMPWRGGDVNGLSSALGISQRQLRRRCHASLGLGPKVMHRLLRFQGFLALGHESLMHRDVRRGYDLAGLASEADYTDQSHLTRECVRLTNQTPSALLDEFARDCVGHDHTAWYQPILQQRNPGAGPGSSAAR